MREICQFIINEHIYTIYDVEKIQGKENYVGRSHYKERTIYIEIDDIEEMLLKLAESGMAKQDIPKLEEFYYD